MVVNNISFYEYSENETKFIMLTFCIYCWDPMVTIIIASYVFAEHIYKEKHQCEILSKIILLINFMSVRKMYS